MAPSMRESPFIPISKRMDSDTGNIIKVVIVSIMLVFFITPITLNQGHVATITLHESPHSPAQNLIQYSLPDTNIPIAVGEVSGSRGFAYILEDESRLYFVDLVQDLSTSIDLPVGTKANGAYMVGYDVDLDGSDEFFLRNFVSPTYYILMVDLNDATVSAFPMPFIYPAIQGFGIFNGDGYPDLVIQNVNNRDNFLTYDVISNATIGTFNADYSYGVTVGRFTSISQDSIALFNTMGTSGQRNLTVVEADGTQVTNVIVSSPIQDMVTFKHGSGLDEIATIALNGDIVVYNGLTLGVIYSQPVDPLSTSDRFIATGDFNLDSQDDLVVVSRDADMAFFRDGNAGLEIRNVTNIYTFTQKNIAVGYMDHDAIQDVTIGTTLGALGTVRGSDGGFSNLEYLIDVQLSTAHQIISYDANFDNRDDVFCRILGDVFLVLSDRTPPEITPRPIDPLHPTILDDYIVVKVDVIESSNIEFADIWMRAPNSMLWMQPQEEMYASHEEGLYYAFIGDLEPGEYEYYIMVQDSYLNTGQLGNSTYPLSFSVAGDFVWQIDKSNTDYVHKIYHQSDIGNLSDGRPTIYTIERASGSLDLTLMKYSRGGGIYDSLTITNPSGIPYDNFVVFTAMLDGDNIADIIVLDYYWDKAGILSYHAFHGSTFTLMGNGTVASPYKSFNYLGVFDDDGDGNEELFLVSDTTPMHIAKMDSDLSWTIQNLPYDSDGRYGVRGFSVANGYIAVIRGDLQIDLLTTDLVYSHSLDIELSAYTNMEMVGIQTLFNATTSEERFVAGFNYWNATDPTGRIYVFDSTTTNLNNTPTYELLHKDMTFLYPADVIGDRSDELFITLPTGELLLVDPGSSLSTIWATFVTSATPLSATIADFDGDTLNEFILFTDQDELLTQVSFTGEVEWTVEVGEVRYPMILGNIDLTPGVEIAAYPFVTVTSYTIGAIRNLDSQYTLDVSVEYGSPEIIQGEGFWANVTVTNIYGEIVDDASVYMSAYFLTPDGPGENTFGFYFDWPSMKYQGFTDATWPIGIVNMSVKVDNGFYHPYERPYVDVVTVRSDLHVSVQAPDLVTQGDSTVLTIWVLDNLGGTVRDAAVTVTVGGIPRSATQTASRYFVTIPEVQLDAGEHLVTATADHIYATGTGTGEAFITVQISSESLSLSTDFPAVTLQDELITAWFNITDSLGQPVEGAMVSLRSGPIVFDLSESTVLGCYIFSHNITLGIGSQIFELVVDKPGIIGPPLAEIRFEVFGNLIPNVFYNPRVEGGDVFDITVFVKDKYGPVANWTSIQVDINGTLYTAYPSASSIPEYTLSVIADFLLGPNTFIVHVNATNGNPWTGSYQIRTYSDASTTAEVISTEGWVLTQGDQTIVELHFVDWADRPVSGATVTVFVKALSYNLLESNPGVYAATLATAGWLPGEYEYVVSIVHPDVETGDPINGSLTVLGNVSFDVTYTPEFPIQGQPLNIFIVATDSYGNPIPDLDVVVEFMGMAPMISSTTDQIGEYNVFIPHVLSTVGYGEFLLTITASGEFVSEAVDTTNTITIKPATPNFAMSTRSLSIGAGVSFVLSLIGMVIYFRMALSLRVDDKSLVGRKKSLKNMDRLYTLIVLGSGAGLVGSYLAYTGGNYAVALVLTVALLGCSVLLYGLWLYRDATDAVLVRGSLRRRRIVFGLWHLVFVPLVIYMILLYGVEIDWFRAYVIDQSFMIGDIAIPSIMTTIFTAYISSILVVVINLYREVSKGIKKIEKMEDAGTPPEIVEDEKTSMVGRFSSSIRIKFLMFLVVVGATTVMSMDFLASWELGVIVLLPVAFLVVIPFISSKIIQLFNKLSRGKISIPPSET